MFIKVNPKFFTELSANLYDSSVTIDDKEKAFVALQMSVAIDRMHKEYERIFGCVPDSIEQE